MDRVSITARYARQILASIKANWWTPYIELRATALYTIFRRRRPWKNKEMENFCLVLFILLPSPKPEACHDLRPARIYVKSAYVLAYLAISQHLLYPLHRIY